MTNRERAACLKISHERNWNSPCISYQLSLSLRYLGGKMHLSIRIKHQVNYKSLTSHEDQLINLIQSLRDITKNANLERSIKVSGHGGSWKLPCPRLLGGWSQFWLWETGSDGASKGRNPEAKTWLTVIIFWFIIIFRDHLPNCMAQSIYPVSNPHKAPSKANS